MTTAQTNASAEVTAIDTAARWPLLLLIVSAIKWLVLSGVLSLIASIQLVQPAFLTDCSAFTYGRVVAMQESVFIYGWAANAGLAIALWVLGRLGGAPLRATNWIVVGTLAWNVALALGLIGIATGDATSITYLQLPRYVQLLMVVAYGAIAVSGVLAWGGRRTEGTFASQWYAVAALFLFPWLFSAAQIMLLWSPVRGTVQAIASGWFSQGLWTLWLAPLALVPAYYIIPKVTGKTLPSYEYAPHSFWCLLVVGGFTGGRHLVGGPVPAWDREPRDRLVLAAALPLFRCLHEPPRRPRPWQHGFTAHFRRSGSLRAWRLGGRDYGISRHGRGCSVHFYPKSRSNSLRSMAGSR